ncbi:Flp pilus assembly protein%2C protease CpaA [Bordetella ansorpii]|uniref:Flp pilus assembly protein, protease CpaA n=1 Tax=Bordetella ansorpii TaxID=288768 RepID=A0A157SXN2_9BORD|nr:prepilin peptidase [Bordetella ansorpii]SAI74706.1 Flp pilus assembly protein%2C protease CpaA [Bordetella ansorpii]
MGSSLPVFIILPALAWVAVSDLLYRRISNRLVLTLLVAWVGYAGWTLMQGAGNDARNWLLTGVLAAAGILVAGYFLFTMRWMGAGDAKLMAVLALWLGDQTFVFLIVTSLAGGALALMLPLLRMVERTLGFGLLQINTWLSAMVFPVPHALQEQPVQGIPYGLAIACGGAFALWGHT